jgi:ribosomal protein L21E
MTLEKAHELIAMNSGLSSGYNRNAARMLNKVMQDHGQQAVDDFLREYELVEAQREIKPATKFGSAFKS